MAANEYAVERLVILDDIDRTFVVTKNDVSIDGLILEPMVIPGQVNDILNPTVYNSLIIQEKQKVHALFKRFKQENPHSPLKLHPYFFSNMSYKLDDIQRRNTLLVHIDEKGCSVAGIITPADTGNEDLGWAFDHYMKDKENENHNDQLIFSGLMNAGKGYTFMELNNHYFHQVDTATLEPGRGYFCRNGNSVAFIVKGLDSIVIHDKIQFQSADDNEIVQAIMARCSTLPKISRFALDEAEHALLRNSGFPVDETKTIMFKKTIFEILYSAVQELHPDEPLNKNIPIEALIAILNKAHKEGVKVNIQFLLVDDADRNINAIKLMFKHYKEKYGISFDLELATTFLDYNATGDDGYHDNGLTFRRRSRTAYSSTITDLSLRLDGPFVSGSMPEEVRSKLLKFPTERAEERKAFVPTPRKLKDGFIKLCETGDAEALFILAQLAARNGSAYKTVKRPLAKVIDIHAVPQDLIAAYYLAKTAYLRTKNEQLKDKLLSFIEEIQSKVLHEVAAGKLPLYTFMDINALRPDQLYEIEIARQNAPLNVQAAKAASSFSSNPSPCFFSSSSSSSSPTSPSKTTIDEQGRKKSPPSRNISAPFFEIVETPAGDVKASDASKSDQENEENQKGKWTTPTQ